MAAILEYLKCFLKEDFQDVTKKFLPKKQEIERLYHKGTLRNRLRLRYPFPQYPNSPSPQFAHLCNLWFHLFHALIRVNSCNSWASFPGF